MSDGYTQGRLQEIEKHVRNLDGMVRVLAAVDRPVLRKQIETAFSDPRVVIVFRGVQRGLVQRKIADELRTRGFPSPTQTFVFQTITQLHEAGFVERTQKGGYTAVEAWDAFNIDKILRKVLKANGVDDLA